MIYFLKNYICKWKVIISLVRRVPEPSGFFSLRSAHPFGFRYTSPSGPPPLATVGYGSYPHLLLPTPSAPERSGGGSERSEGPTTPVKRAGGAAYVTPRRVPSSFVSDPRRVAPLRGSCLRRVMRRKGSVGKETAWREEERRLSRGLCCLRYPPPSLGSLMIATLSIRPCEGPTEGRSHA